jgi:hypothetical protein
MLTYIQVYAQIPLRDDNFLNQVKTLDEFIARFNNSKNMFDGYKKIAKTDTSIINFQKRIFGKDSINRNQMLITVFNMDKVEKIGKDKIMQFAKQVNDSVKPILLSFYDMEWYAELSCEVLYKKQAKKVTLIMQSIVSATDKKASSWHLVGCYADFLQVEPKNKQKTQGLKPNENDLSFIELITLAEDKENVATVTKKDFQADLLSILLYAVKNGDVTLQQVTSTKYHFLQIPNWIFVVENYQRNTSNSGWLISDLQNKTEIEKKNYKAQILHVK